MTAAIIHYNTPEMTGALVRSLRKWSPKLDIVIFDNSDARPFLKMDGVHIIDNTIGQEVNFAEMLMRYPDKLPTACNWGSEKHIASVDRLFDLLPDGFILLDSDILLKQDIGPLADPSFAWVGTIQRHPQYWFQTVRLLPFLLWINVPMLRGRGIRFFHEGMVYKMSHTGTPFYDTGGSLLVDCKAARLPGREVNINDYMVHFGGGSCGRTLEFQLAWVRAHRHCYE